MHNIELVRLKFSNVLSYGNNETIVEFNDGLTWIKGPNGAGKSTIIEALTFALFGKPYRDINKANLKNTANKNKLTVELEFIRTDVKSTDTYIIRREMQKTGSSTFTIIKNGESEKKGAGITQKMFEDEVLGFDQNIFNNIISLNTIQTTPIIDMEPKDKRSLLEAVVSLCMDRYKDLNKKALREATTKLDSAKSDVVKYERDVNEIGSIIETMEHERENDIHELEEEVTEIKQTIQTHSASLSKLGSDMSDVTSNGLSLKSEYDALANVETEYANLDSVRLLLPQLDVNREKLVAARDLVVKLTPTNDEFNEKFEKYNITEINSSVEKNRKSILELERRQSSAKTKIEILKADMDHIQNDVTNLKAGIPCQTCGKESTENDIEAIKKQYRQTWKEKNSSVKALTDTIQTIQSQITDINESTKTLSVELTAYNEIQLEYNKFLGDWKSANSSVTSLETDIKVNEGKIKQLGISDISVIEKRLEQLKTDIQRKNALQAQLNDLRYQINTLKTTKSGLVTSIGELEEKRDRLLAKIEQKKSTTNEDSLATTKIKLEACKGDLTTAFERVSKYSDEISVCSYIEKMFGDNGIKKMILGIFVPNFNKAIAKNLAQFSLPFTLEFDDAMNSKFSSRYGLAQVYHGLSQGQKRKLNFAIAMAFRDFVTSIADFKINTLFLDEVLDISTDEDALKDMVALVKQKSKDIGGVYIISHRGEVFDDYLDHEIEIQFDGRYSSLTQRELVSSRINN